MEKLLPKFRYHPEPLKTGVIERRLATCPVCLEKVDFVYIGPFYSTEEIENICPWCIENGNAAKKYDGEFQDAASIESDIEENKLEELIYKTPGYHGWQQEMWLVHCGEPCQYIGTVGWKEIQEQNIDVEDDISKLSNTYSLSKDNFKKSLTKNGSMQGYLFKCIRCGKYRLHCDCD